MNSSDSAGSQTQKYDAQRSCGVSILGGAQDLARLSPDHLLALVTLLWEKGLDKMLPGGPC